MPHKYSFTLHFYFKYLATPACFMLCQAVAVCPCFRYFATSSQTAKVAGDTGPLLRVNLRVPVSDTSLQHPIICTSAKVIQVPCPGRVNLRVPVSDTSLRHPIIYTPLSRWYRSPPQAGLTSVCLFQIPPTSSHNLYTSVKVVQVPCPGRVNLRVPVSDTSLRHPIIYTPLSRWYRSRAQAGLTCLCLFQIPRYVIP